MSSSPRVLAALALLGSLLTARADGEVSVEVRYDPKAAGTPNAKAVFVSGEFNGWAPDAWPMTQGRDGVFRRALRLAPGVYRYKLVVDGAWTHDPTNPRREPGGHRNSVLVVGDVPEPDLARPDDVQGSPASRIPHPRDGRASAFLTIPASDLPAPPDGVEARPLHVYLPPSYDREVERRYPVVYLHDGQNVWSEPGICFGHGGWSLDSTCDRLWKSGAIEHAILVGVPHAQAREQEYAALSRGREAPYVRYLCDVVKPAVDARLRTRPAPEDTSCMGSSLGGLVSFLLALERPDVFGQAACLSPSFWYRDAGVSAFDLLARRKKQPARIYLDSGTAGPSQDGAPDTRRMVDALRAAGWAPTTELVHHEAQGASHDEGAWRARAERPLRFLLAPR